MSRFLYCSTVQNRGTTSGGGLSTYYMSPCCIVTYPLGSQLQFFWCQEATPFSRDSLSTVFFVKSFCLTVQLAQLVIGFKEETTGVCSFQKFQARSQSFLPQGSRLITVTIFVLLHCAKQRHPQQRGSQYVLYKFLLCYNSIHTYFYLCIHPIF